jgi:hypothetical protein
MRVAAWWAYRQVVSLCDMVEIMIEMMRKEAEGDIERWV